LREAARPDIIGTMFTLDDPPQVLAFVTPSLGALRAALDAGISYADTILDRQPFDAYFWSHSVRYHAVQVLDRAPQVDWTVGRKLPNSGIELRQDPVLMRLLKSQGDGPPHPGSSRARRRFYRQQLRLPMPWGDLNTSEGANLIVDWEVGERREVLLALSKPVGVWDYQGTPSIEWRLPVVFGNDGEARFAAMDDDLELEPQYDIEEGSGSNASA
jgi:hypothetical protein